ncbi:MAG: helix-turn-helix domain-containing protein [Cellvibrionaceae bacterium]|nr:helix-turn-helix domain-containing protein [Cellvibrionaceae bacterium]
MISFYRQTIFLSLAMLVGTGVYGFLVYYLSYYSHKLLPHSDSAMPWNFQAYSDRELDGNSSINVIESKRDIHFSYSIANTLDYPFVTVILDFSSDGASNKLANLSKYTSISFFSHCQHLMEISLQLHNYDQQVTRADIFSSYRVAQQNFLCKKDDTLITMDLSRFVVPVWWLSKHNVGVTQNTYSLEATRAISFFIQSNEAQTDTEVYISQVKLHGRNWYYTWVGSGLLVLLWLGYFLYLFRLYTKHLVASVQKRIVSNKPFIAYQQLSLNPHKDKVKNQLLRFMAEEFHRPEMNLNFTVEKLGLNRNKINALLKEELDLTFTAYLNKLRLTEVANQITQHKEKNISEIAHSVGYNNISYFNRVFKNEYGCTPRKFREVSRKN